MHPKIVLLFLYGLLSFAAHAQEKGDSLVSVKDNYITLSEIVINQHLDLDDFIRRVKNDTTFFKAFRNLHIVGYTALNDIRMQDRKGKVEASLDSKIRQYRTGNCRRMDIISEKHTGDIYDKHGDFNYYTMQMYASLFFTRGSICGEDNIVAGRDFSTSGLRGLEKHKEQLKMLFFNPGKRINGLPFISNKTAIFDDRMMKQYDLSLDMDTLSSHPCYVFSIKVKPGHESAVVVDEMTTWFDQKTFEVLSRNYHLMYNAGFYDFDVSMKVKMTHVQELLVPSLLEYHGNWNALFKKRERGVFKANLFDFVR